MSHVSLSITLFQSQDLMQCQCTLVPEGSEPVPAGTVICTTFNEGNGHDEDEN